MAISDESTYYSEIQESQVTLHPPSLIGWSAGGLVTGTSDKESEEGMLHHRHTLRLHWTACACIHIVFSQNANAAHHLQVYQCKYKHLKLHLVIPVAGAPKISDGDLRDRG